jgi:hypothetical protein
MYFPFCYKCRFNAGKMFPLSQTSYLILYWDGCKFISVLIYINLCPFLCLTVDLLLFCYDEIFLSFSIELLFASDPRLVSSCSSLIIDWYISLCLKCYCVWVYYAYITWLRGRYTRIFSPRWRESPGVLCHPIPKAEGDITLQGFHVTEGKKVW